MSDGDLEFPAAPLSPSLPSDFLEPPPRNACSSSPSGPAAEPPASTNSYKGTTSKGSASKAKDSLRSAPASANASSISPKAASSAAPATKTQRGTQNRSTKMDPVVRELRAQLSRWIETARGKKHDSDKAGAERKHRLSIVLGLDALVCFMIGFEYEDRVEAARGDKQPSPTRSWLSLVPFLAKLGSSAKSIDADLAGVCYQVLAVVRLHAASYQRRTGHPAEEIAKTLFTALADFSTGLRLLPLGVIRERYGLTPKDGWIATKLNAAFPDPLHDRAALPLHVNSAFGECAAFALSIGMKWARLEGVEYAWEAAKP